MHLRRGHLRLFPARRPKKFTTLLPKVFALMFNLDLCLNNLTPGLSIFSYCEEFLFVYKVNIIEDFIDLY